MNKTTEDRKGSKSKFIPLRDLLRKSHADRVQDYLNKMEEEEEREHGEVKENDKEKTPTQATGGSTKRKEAHQKEDLEKIKGRKTSKIDAAAMENKMTKISNIGRK